MKSCSPSSVTSRNSGEPSSPSRFFCFLLLPAPRQPRLGFWNRVQHRWSPSFYCVSHGAPLPRASLLTIRPQFCLVLFVTKWWCYCHGLGGLFRSASYRNPATYSRASLVGRRQFLHLYRRPVDGRTCFGRSYIRGGML